MTTIRRRALLCALLATALVLLTTTGCEPKKEAQKTEAAGESAETAPAETAAAEGPAGGDEAPAAGEAAAGDEAQPAEAGGDAAAAEDGVDWAAVLADPSKATHKAPETFKIELQTTEGPVVLEIYREWSPNGVDRLYNLVKSGYLNDLAVFRMVEGFVAQFGMHGDPAINTKWSEANIKDDPVTHSNEKGTIVFAMAGPDTRSTQFFINLVNNKRLDQMGFSPLGKVVEGLENVEKFHAGYGDGPPRGTGPDQGKIHEEGNAYLKREFPELDYIQSARVITD